MAVCTPTCISGINRFVVGPVAQICCCEPHMAKWDSERGKYSSPQKLSGYAVIFAGSFNPPHAGHAEVISFLAASHKQVHLVIGVNPKKTYPVSGEARKEILEHMVQEAGFQNVRVHVWGGYVWKLAAQLGAKRLARGVRSWEEDGKPERYLQVQNLLWPVLLACLPPIKTTYVEAPPQLRNFSSTLLRQRLERGESIDDMVPNSIARQVAAAYVGKL
mmetsp:Transcript_53870/g.104219  ORF Transcript_53870/g.104219 Transcript_53870/m.104219 type:complete len:218 (+) Transcript_53870:51-704(+)